MKIKNFSKVDSDLYRSGKLTPIDVFELKKFGIKQIISLDKDIGLNIKKACQDCDIKQLILPIDIEDNKSIRNVLTNDFVDNIKSNSPTLVHCRAGKDRTGLVCAVYSLLNGKDIKDVKKKLFYFGFGIGLNPKAKDYYLKIINAVSNSKKQKKDVLNNSSLVELSRDYVDGDPQWGYLDDPKTHSFSPYEDFTRSYPYDTVYPEILSTEYMRDVYKPNKKQKNVFNLDLLEEKYLLPNVGLYYNDINSTGLGPSELSGIFYD